MITYEGITEANKLIKYTDVRGKNYAEVAQRVQAFRKLMPEGFITTEILSLDPDIVYMKAEAGFYDKGQKVLLAVGHAFERRDASNINKTSYIENCETSAIGRALGFIGFGSEKSIASAEEVKNAIDTQEAIDAGMIPERPPRKKVVVEKSATVPPADPVPPVLAYFAKEREALRTVREISKEENDILFKAQLNALIAANAAPKKPLSKYTQDEAAAVIKAMYERFTPTGTELKTDDGDVA